MYTKEAFETNIHTPETSLPLPFSVSPYYFIVVLVLALTYALFMLISPLRWKNKPLTPSLG